MSTRVTSQMSISLDGYYAGERFDGNGSWIDSAEAAGFFRITRWVIDAQGWRERQNIAGGEQGTSSDLMAEYFARSGAYVMGRRMFDGGEIPWGDEPPFRAPVFVVTSRPREQLRKGATTFTFVTDGFASAIEQARAVANGKHVAVAGGGTVVRQVLAAGLLDELELHIVPVVLGSGMRLLDDDGFGLGGRAGIELTPTRVINTPEATHITYDVVGPVPLVLDDRGRGSAD